MLPPRALLPGRGFGATPQGFFGRHHLPIGLQLYTVGEAVRKDLDDAFTKIAGIGFTVLEAAGYHGQTPAALREAAARHGMKITSVHVNAVGRGGDPGLDGDLPKLAAELHALGVTDAVMPMFPVPERAGAQRPGDRVAVHRRQLDVQQDQIRRDFPGRLHAQLAVRRRHHLVAVLFQQEHGQVTVLRIVFYNQ